MKGSGVCVFCFSIFCVCYSNLEVLEGALLHFTHWQKSRTPPHLHHPQPLKFPPPPVTQQGQKAKASPALQPQRWTWTPRGTRGRPAGTWAVVSHRVRQRVRMLNAIWPCHSLGEAGRESGERVKVKSRKTEWEKDGGKSHKDREQDRGPARAERIHQYSEMKEKKRFRPGIILGQYKKALPLCRLGV